MGVQGQPDILTFQKLGLGANWGGPSTKGPDPGRQMKGACPCVNENAVNACRNQKD